MNNASELRAGILTPSHIDHRSDAAKPTESSQIRCWSPGNHCRLSAQNGCGQQAFPLRWCRSDAIDAMVETNPAPRLDAPQNGALIESRFSKLASVEGAVLTSCQLIDPRLIAHLSQFARRQRSFQVFRSVCVRSRSTRPGANQSLDSHVEATSKKDSSPDSSNRTIRAVSAMAPAIISSVYPYLTW